MQYALFDVDVRDPLVIDAPPADGIGVLVRIGKRPVDFFVEPTSHSQRLTSVFLCERILRNSNSKIVRESLTSSITGTPGSGIEANAASRFLPAVQRPTDELTITIAICTKDRSELLDRTLASVTAHLEEVGDDQTEILVIDNKSSDDRTRLVAGKYPTVRYVREELAGLDFARNRAMHEARGFLLAYLDDDAIVDHGWLPGLQDAFATNPDAGGFTGQVLPLELSTEAQVLFELNGGFRRGFRRIRFDPELQANPMFPGGAGVFGTGTNMAFRRDLLLELGGFDEALDTGAPLPGGGDHDMFYRIIRSNNAMVYEPTYLVFHEHRRDISALRRQYYSWGTGVMAFLSKSYETDPDRRRNLRTVMRWWFRDRLRQYVRSIRGKHPLPASMIGGELRGGVVGLLGEYRRSKRRVELIRQQR